MAIIKINTLCRLFEPNYRIMRYQFDVDPPHEWIGEYVVCNLMRERGELINGAPYQIEFTPLLPRFVKG